MPPMSAISRKADSGWHISLKSVFNLERTSRVVGVVSENESEPLRTIASARSMLSTRAGCLGCIDQRVPAMSRFVFATILVIAFAGAAFAGWIAGMEAYNRGDYATAFEELLPVAKRGDSNAQNQIGYLYSRGLGVSRDYTEAEKWFRKAAEQGDPAAQSNLGYAFYGGQGVARNFEEAAEWLRKSAEQDGVNSVKAQALLGHLYVNGQGVPQDDQRAAKWLRKAAHRGHAQAQSELGVMYLNGKGVSKDGEKAAKLFRRAARKGHVQSQIFLGRMYSEGRGVGLDVVAANMWFEIAASYGNQIAQGLLHHAKNGMSPNQIAEARKLAREWLQKYGK